MMAGDAGAASAADSIVAAATRKPWLTRGRQMPDSHLRIDSSWTPGLIAATIFKLLRRWLVPWSASF